MNKLTTKQVGKLIVVSVLSLKLITFPALYVNAAGHDAYLAMLLTMIGDLTIFSVLIYVAHINPNKTFEEILSKKFGGFVTDTVFFGMFVYYLVKGVFLVKEHHNYLLETLFNYLPWQTFMIPLVALMGFIMSRSLRSIGRSIEILYPLIIGGLVLTMAIPLRSFDFSNLLPFMENGFRPIYAASSRNIFSSGDFMIFIILMGRYKTEKNTTKYFFKSLIKAMALVLIFYIVFIGVFGKMAENQSLAISDLPLHASFPYNLGRIDWIMINLWTITLIFQTGVMLSLSLFAFTKVFKIKNKQVGVIIILAMVVIGAFFLFFNLSRAVGIVTQPLFVAVTILFECLTSTLILIGSLNFRKEKNVYNKKVFSK